MMIMWLTVTVHQERLAVWDKRADSFMYFVFPDQHLTLCNPCLSLSFSWNFSNVLSASPRIHILRTWSPQWEMGPSGHCLGHKVQVLINESKLPQEEFVVAGLLLSFFLLLYFSLLKYFPRGGALYPSQVKINHRSRKLFHSVTVW